MWRVPVVLVGAVLAIGLTFGACGTLATGGLVTAGGGSGTGTAGTGSGTGTAGTGSGTGTAGGGGVGAGGSGVLAVPASWEALDRRAAATCPGLSWSVLAAIGDVESDSGRSTLPGVASGANAAGAEGPMQFEPATFAYGRFRRRITSPKRAL